MADLDRLPTLEAPAVRLRAMSERDVDALFEIFSDPDVVRYWSSPALADRAAAEALLAGIQEHFRRQDLFQWGVVVRGDDRVVGTCTLAAIDRSNRRGEIGFALRRDCWGNGYIAQALTALLNHAFGELGLRRIEADIDPRNAASIRSVERLGFRCEGHLRERWFVDGKTQDSLIYGLLDREWRAGP